MTQSNMQTLYDIVLKQIATESFFNDVDLADDDEVIARLRFGNNDPENLYVAQLAQKSEEDFASLPGHTRMTTQQATYFVAKYQVVDQLSNTATGFSNKQKGPGSNIFCPLTYVKSKTQIASFAATTSNAIARLRERHSSDRLRHDALCDYA